MLEYQLHLDEVVALTEKMLASGKEAKWDDVVGIENRRQEKLLVMESCSAKFAQASIGKDEEKIIADKLNYIIALNKKILLMSSDEKVACFNRFSKNKNTQKAFSAYSSF